LPSQTPLLWIIRDHIGLTGTRNPLFRPKMRQRKIAGAVSVSTKCETALMEKRRAEEGDQAPAHQDGDPRTQRYAGNEPEKEGAND
jgi:hypothetical protein